MGLKGSQRAILVGKALYEQESHSRPTYSLAIHCDGSLLASGGLDNTIRIWDLRIGNSIMTLKGHSKPVLSLDFSPNGYYLSTGSLDNTCQLRQFLLIIDMGY